MPLFVYAIEGWDFSTVQDMQPLWDCNPFMNTNATAMYMEFLNYGPLSNESWSNAWNRGYSTYFCVQQDLKDQLGFDGFAIGLRFTETSEETIVRRYCPNETYLH